MYTFITTDWLAGPCPDASQRDMATRAPDTDKIVIEYLIANGYNKAAAEVLEQQRLRKEQMKPSSREHYIVDTTTAEISNTMNENYAQSNIDTSSNSLDAVLVNKMSPSMDNARNGDKNPPNTSTGNGSTSSGNKMI